MCLCFFLKLVLFHFSKHHIDFRAFRVCILNNINSQIGPNKMNVLVRETGLDPVCVAVVVQ